MDNRSEQSETEERIQRGRVVEESIRVVSQGIPVRDCDFDEGDEMRRLVKDNFLSLAGVGYQEPQQSSESIQEEAPRTPEPIMEGKRIARTPGSYGVDSPEVKTYLEAIRRGRPITLYEFMQGMVDYGTDKMPPPRIWIEHKSGKRYTYNGHNGIEKEDDPIIAIEFINGGSGLDPEDVTINYHGGGESTLGKYGKGLTLSIVCLIEEGMNVKLRSHSRDRIWQGTTGLEDTETKKTRTLFFEGEWQHVSDDPRELITVIRVENPTKNFIKGVTQSSDLFLFANPKFPDASLVDNDKESCKKEPIFCKVDKGKVTCLDGIIEEREDGEYRCLYVDGLNMNFRGLSILPWSIQGLGEANNGYMRVERSHNSMEISAFEVSNPILFTVQSLVDKDILRRLIQCQIDNPQKEYLEFRNTHRGMQIPMADETAKIIREIWEEMHESNSVIGCSEKMIRWYKKLGSSQKGVVDVPVGLYRVLDKAGINTIENETATQDVVEYKGLTSINVPSATKGDRIEVLMDYISRIDGEVEMVERNGKKCMSLMFPKIVRSKDEFNGKTENFEGIIMKTAAVIAHMANMECEIHGVTEEFVYKIKFVVEEKGRGEYGIKAEIEAIDRDRVSEFDEYETGWTYIVLSGEEVQNYTSDAMEKVEELRKRREKKRGGMPGQRRRKGKFDREIMERIVIQKREKIGIGQNKRHDAIQGRERDSEEELPNGYYQGGTASNFVFDEKEKECSWIEEGELEEETIRRCIPPKYHSAIVLQDFESEQTEILVPTGHVIIGYKSRGSSEIKFYRNKRTGNYMVSGSTKKLVIYTFPDSDDYYERQEPTEEECEDLLVGGYKHLLPEWREFIEDVGRNPALITGLKVALAQGQWSKRFRYDTDYAKGSQTKGDSKGIIAASILNTSRGICNLSATGFAILLRSIGIPSRVCFGHWKQSDMHGGTHMWVEYWNGVKWKTHESLKGVIEAGSEGEKLLVEQLVESLRRQISGAEEQISTARTGLEIINEKTPILSRRKTIRKRIQLIIDALSSK